MPQSTTVYAKIRYILTANYNNTPSPINLRGRHSSNKLERLTSQRFNLILRRKTSPFRAILLPSTVTKYVTSPRMSKTNCSRDPKVIFERDRLNLAALLVWFDACVNCGGVIYARIS